ncbi:hypothetical protein [Exiguobacterium undae]
MCDDRTDSITAIASLFELSVTNLNRWRIKYRKGGSMALRNRTEWTRYPEELKMKAVRAVLDQEESLTSATVRFNISDMSVLVKWIEKYTGHSTQGKPLKERSKVEPLHSKSVSRQLWTVYKTEKTIKAS